MLANRRPLPDLPFIASVLQKRKWSDDSACRGRVCLRGFSQGLELRMKWYSYTSLLLLLAFRGSNFVTLKDRLAESSSKHSSSSRATCLVSSPGWGAECYCWFPTLPSIHPSIHPSIKPSIKPSIPLFPLQPTFTLLYQTRHSFDEGDHQRDGKTVGGIVARLYFSLEMVQRKKTNKQKRTFLVFY